MDKISFFVAGAGISTSHISYNSTAEQLWIGKGYSAFLGIEVTTESMEFSFIDMNDTVRYSSLLLNNREPTSQPTVYLQEMWNPEPDPGLEEEAPIVQHGNMYIYYEIDKEVEEFPFVFVSLAAVLWVISIVGYVYLWTHSTTRSSTQLRPNRSGNCQQQADSEIRSDHGLICSYSQ